MKEKHEIQQTTHKLFDNNSKWSESIKLCSIPSYADDFSEKKRVWCTEWVYVEIESVNFRSFELLIVCVCDVCVCLCVGINGNNQSTNQKNTHAYPHFVTSFRNPESQDLSMQIAIRNSLRLNYCESNQWVIRVFILIAATFTFHNSKKPSTPKYNQLYNKTYCDFTSLTLKISLCEQTNHANQFNHIKYFREPISIRNFTPTLSFYGSALFYVCVSVWKV